MNNIVRSLIVIEVEHGESLDGLESLFESVTHKANIDAYLITAAYPEPVRIKDHYVRVDVPDGFRV